MISVICCYNNKSLFDRMLKSSVENQQIVYELIGIDTVNNNFPSAASALNYGTKLASGNYYVFAHQDIEIYSDHFLKDIVQYINELDNSIVGVAGKKDSKGVYSNISHIDKNTPAGDIRITKSEEVQTLDECLIAMSKEVYEKLKFDEVTCDNWHLYAVDLCLSAKKKNIKSYVVPLNAFHASTGSLTKEYWYTMDNLVRKHKINYSRIFTTCVDINTNYFSYFYFRKMINVKTIVKGLLKSFG